MSADSVTAPDYAQHVTPEVAAWLAQRANPRFTPKPPPKATGKPPKLSEARRAKLTRENLRRFGTPAQLAAFTESETTK